MNVWILVLFLAGQKIEPPGYFDTKAACIEYGKEEVEKFKSHHPHSKGWFWCVRGKDV